ncbi:MAG TPA: polysaccharide biosynthesis/export family protein [Phycisphaerae bacterium]|nr:polysaccharide biosynthesis/export family protein [Phycisphaerae bacterium]
MEHAKGLAAFMRPGLMVLGVLLTGCHSFWQGWLDPSQVGRFEQASVTHDIRTVISILDEPPGVPDATEPTPEDMVTESVDYVIGSGDVVDVSVLDLLQLGAPWVERDRVTDSGYVTLTGIGRVKAGGKTARQVELSIVEQLRDKIRDAQVRVIVQEQRNRKYNMLGSVARPGTYFIPRAEFRLLDAISAAGDFPPTVEEIYVIRPAESQPDAADVSPATAAPIEQGDQRSTAPAGSDRMGMPDRTDPPLGELAAYAVPGSQPAGGSAFEADQRQLLEALGPAGAGAPSPGESAEAEGAGSIDSPPLTNWMWVNGEWVELKTSPDGQAAEPSEGEPQQREFDWESLAEPLAEGRVIGIPVRPLLEGQSRYNIVIRDGDTIRVPIGPIGEFYMMGHIQRPGVYSLTGREMTLKQAIAQAGGLSGMAWPSKCEITRRLGRDREQVVQVDVDRIFAGKAPDIFLRPNDTVNVGTHALAPFLLVVRNAFRISYGFGFVYDRNFADIDSYGSQANPRDRRRAERAARFPTVGSILP